LTHRGSGIATLYECDENEGFFTACCDPYMGHTPRLFFYTFPLKKIQRIKMPEVRIKLDKSLRISNFFKFILFNDFLRNLALK
jgi:hypothetical protein